MNPGELKNKIVIQENNPTKDNEGVLIDHWEDVASVWAAIEPLYGKEYFQAQVINHEATGKIRIRYRSGLTAEMRAVKGTRIFNFVAPPIDVKEKHQELIILYREVV